jgi:hypothetical protein
MPKTSAANLVTSGRAATTVPAAPGSGKRFLVRAPRSPPSASGTAGPPADAMYPDEPAARTFTGTPVPALSGRAICAARHTPAAPQVSCTIAGLACRRSGGAVPPPFPAAAAARPAGPITALMAVQARLEPGWLDAAQPPPTRRHAYHGQRTEPAGHRQRTEHSEGQVPPYATSGLAARGAPPGPRAAGRNLNLVYTQINEHTFLLQTLRPLRRRDNCADRRGGAPPGWPPI